MDNSKYTFSEYLRDINCQYMIRICFVDGEVTLPLHIWNEIFKEYRHQIYDFLIDSNERIVSIKIVSTLNGDKVLSILSNEFKSEYYYDKLNLPLKGDILRYIVSMNRKNKIEKLLNNYE